MNAWFDLVFLIPVQRLVVVVEVPVSLSLLVWLGKVPVSSGYLPRYLLLSRCSRTNAKIGCIVSRVLIGCFRSANCLLPIVKLNVFVQSNPSMGMKSVLWLLVLPCFVCCFRTQCPPVFYPWSFTSFSLPSWYRFVTFCISVGSTFLLSVGIIVIRDPVSIWLLFSLHLFRLLLCSVCLFVSSISLISFMCCMLSSNS